MLMTRVGTMTGNNEDKCRREGNNDSFHKKPLYVWAKSFVEKESQQKEETFTSFVAGNALSYALEYVGIIPEAEQSSLHLSAIFEEESQQSKNRFPNHYESETKNRIQSLNRMFTELKSYFEDHFSQLVAFKPPNSVHIISACQSCSVQELEKLLFMLLGAAIQGSQKQDTIKKIKRFPPDVQEALIEHIKLISDNPDVLHVKSWSEFSSQKDEEQQKLYENLLSLIRRLLFERNQIAQTQLMSDYFAGYMYCGQRRIYEGKGFGPESEYDDARLNAALRQLKEELHEKTELLQECREELEVSRSRVQELQAELLEAQQQLKSCKKARDELDALREKQEKASRLEAELQRMKKKLQDSEQYFERVEVLQTENRNLQLQNESLQEQNSFLTIEKESLKFLMHSEPLLNINSKAEDDDAASEDNAEFLRPDFNSTEKGHNNLLNLEAESESLEKDLVNQDEQQEQLLLPTEANDAFNSEEKTNEFEQQVPDVPFNDVEQVEFNDDEARALDKRTKRRRRSSLLNIKRTRRTLLLPVRGTQKLLPGSSVVVGDENEQHPKQLGEKYPEHRSVAIRVIRVCHAPSSKRKCCSHARNRRSKSLRRRQSSGKQPVPLDMENDADEELSISPNGVPNLSDIENCPENENQGGNDSDIYFVCSTRKPEESSGFVERTFPITVYSNNNSPLKLSNSHCINSTDVPVKPNDANDDASDDKLVCVNTRNIDIANYGHRPLVENGHCTCRTEKNIQLDDVHDDNSNLDHSHSSMLNCTNCRIRVNVNRVENYSTHVSLNLNNIVQYEGRNNELTRTTSGFHDSQLSKTIPKSNLGNISMRSSRDVTTSDEEEDDDSVWYEYGCV